MIPSCLYSSSLKRLVHTTIGCGKQGFPSAQPYLSHILNVVNNQRTLDLEVASVSVFRVKAGENRAKEMRTPTVMCCFS